MLDVDPPDHTRLRQLVHKAFTPRLVEQTPRTTPEPDGGADRGGRETGPYGSDRRLRPADSDDDHRGDARRARIGPPPVSPLVAQNRRVRPVRLLTAIPSAIAFLRYIRKLVQSRRASPRDDLVTALVQAEEEGARLTEDELVAMIFLLLIAEHETTVNLIGNGMLALLRHPDQLKRLRDEPGMIKPAIEELLRFDGPLETATERYARADVEVAGTIIRRGDLVYAVLGSANRDERQFPEPDRLDLTREPNRHLAFGLGIIYRLGAPLARLEGQIAIGTLVSRLPTLQLTRRPLRWRRSLVLRGLAALPVLAGK